VVGSDADVIVFDPSETRVVQGGELHSAAGYSLYEGEPLTGWPVQTFVRGQLVFDRGSIVAQPGRGRHAPQG
jgi:dihydropyrimidinase